jgi:ribosomal protein S12
MSSDEKVDAKQVTTDARGSRMTVLRKTNEEVLRKQLQLEARQKCQHAFKAFSDCAKETGLLVVFQCRQQNSDMSTCMEQHYNEEEFKKFCDREGVQVQERDVVLTTSTSL